MARHSFFCIDGHTCGNPVRLVAAGGPTIPEPLITQLKVGGRLVLPVGESRDAQRLMRVVNTEQGRKVEDHGACAFVPLIGQHGWTER